MQDKDGGYIRIPPEKTCGREALRASQGHIPRRDIPQNDTQNSTAGAGIASDAHRGHRMHDRGKHYRNTRTGAGERHRAAEPHAEPQSGDRGCTAWDAIYI